MASGQQSECLRSFQESWQGPWVKTEGTTHLKTEGTPQSPILPALLWALGSLQLGWLAVLRNTFSVPSSSAYVKSRTGDLWGLRALLLGKIWCSWPLSKLRKLSLPAEATHILLLFLSPWCPITMPPIYTPAYWYQESSCLSVRSISAAHMSNTCRPQRDPKPGVSIVTSSNISDEDSSVHKRKKVKESCSFSK